MDEGRKRNRAFVTNKMLNVCGYLEYLCPCQENVMRDLSKWCYSKVSELQFDLSRSQITYIQQCASMLTRERFLKCVPARKIFLSLNLKNTFVWPTLAAIYKAQNKKCPALILQTNWCTKQMSISQTVDSVVKLGIERTFHCFPQELRRTAKMLDFDHSQAPVLQIFRDDVGIFMGTTSKWFAGWRNGMTTRLNITKSFQCSLLMQNKHIYMYVLRRKGAGNSCHIPYHIK